MPIFSSSSQEGPSASRSFLSRLSVPLRPAVNRNIHDFHIRLHEPHRDYAAGDTVSGAVVLILTKTLRITHMVVALHGYVRVTTTDRLEDEDTTRPVGDCGVRFHGKGYLTLFQQEKVLGDESALKGPGQFEFPFEMKFPGSAEDGLPSSIDFESGTIKYDLIATMTRPTTISPTMRTFRKLNVVEKIDIGTMREPLIETRWIDPVRRKKRPGRAERQRMQREPTEPSSDAESTRRSVVSEEPVPEQLAVRQNGEPADVRSTFSVDSNVSESTGTLPTVDGMVNYPGAGIDNLTAAKLQEMDEQTIRVDAMAHKRGFLPGEQLPMTFVVQHNKKMKSVHGIIATLYRECRIDPAPPSDHFLGRNRGDMRRLPTDEYYPKPRSGLRGLSLSSTKRSWRKDLCQAVAPLFIDPRTLSAEVTVTLRVPEDSFPTIVHIPGGMLSFTYRIEVIIDLSGKLDSQLRSSSGPSRSYSTAPSTYMWSPSIIDTGPLKDQPGLVRYPGMEIFVGTTDGGKDQGQPPNMFTNPTNDSPASQNWGDASWTADNQEASPNGVGHTRPPLMNGHFRQSTETEGVSPMQNRHQGEAPPYIPPPSAPNLSQMSEKERIRHQEQILLPSQPPQELLSEAGPSGSAPPEEALPPIAGMSLAPSAPSASSAPSAPADVGPSAQTPSAPPASAPAMDDNSLPPAPSYTYPSEEGGPSAPVERQEPSSNAAADDKHELERRRLLHEASAPPEFPEDCVASTSRAPAGSSAPPEDEAETEPSAPVLTEEDEYHMIAGPSTSRAMNGEALPRYER